jgi:Ca2+/Na+ antiporter
MFVVIAAIVVRIATIFSTIACWKNYDKGLLESNIHRSYVHFFTFITIKQQFSFHARRSSWFRSCVNIIVVVVVVVVIIITTLEEADLRAQSTRRLVAPVRPRHTNALHIIKSK